MKVNELLMGIHNKEFDLERRLQVKKYLPIEVKKTIAQSIIFECTDEENGVIKVDSVQRYLSYVRYMIIMHTNLEYTDEDYDTICSNVYGETTLLNAIMKCFDEDAKECSRILNLVTDDYVQEHSIENAVYKFLHNLNESIGNVANILTDKVNSVDIKNIIPEDYDPDTLNKFLNQYIK